MHGYGYRISPQTSHNAFSHLQSSNMLTLSDELELLPDILGRHRLCRSRLRAIGRLNGVE